MFATQDQAPLARFRSLHSRLHLRVLHEPAGLVPLLCAYNSNSLARSAQFRLLSQTRETRIEDVAMLVGLLFYRTQPLDALMHTQHTRLLRSAKTRQLNQPIGRSVCHSAWHALVAVACVAAAQLTVRRFIVSTRIASTTRRASSSSCARTAALWSTLGKNTSWTSFSSGS